VCYRVLRVDGPQLGSSIDNSHRTVTSKSCRSQDAVLSSEFAVDDEKGVNCRKLKDHKLSAYLNPLLNCSANNVGT
jgi:hypothetical protein